jgi:hypothetical protein
VALDCCFLTSETDWNVDAWMELGLNDVQGCRSVDDGVDWSMDVWMRLGRGGVQGCCYLHRAALKSQHDYETVTGDGD